jgi:hypothetical protein
MKVQIAALDASANNLSKALNVALNGVARICGSYEIKTSDRDYGTKVTIKFEEGTKKKAIKSLSKALNGFAIVKNAEYESPSFFSERRRLIVRVYAPQLSVDALLASILTGTSAYADVTGPGDTTRFVTPRA